MSWKILPVKREPFIDSDRGTHTADHMRKYTEDDELKETIWSVDRAIASTGLGQSTDTASRTDRCAVRSPKAKHQPKNPFVTYFLSLLWISYRVNRWSTMVRHLDLFIDIKARYANSCTTSSAFCFIVRSQSVKSLPVRWKHCAGNKLIFIFIACIERPSSYFEEVFHHGIRHHSVQLNWIAYRNGILFLTSSYTLSSQMRTSCRILWLL